MNKIYIIEGADGTGKTTLANEMATELNASIIHCTYDKNWNIFEYHKNMYAAAKMILPYTNVILDRFSLSELVYGNVFRDGEQYDVLSYMKQLDMDSKIKWIYCKNENAIENHIRNKKERQEMYPDMAKVVELYDSYIANDYDRKWNIYDFDEISRKEFIKRFKEQEK
jgi:thymidylate kinase